MSYSNKRDNASPAPSDKTGRWLGRLIELSLLIIGFVALSSWLGSHLLDDGSQIPELSLPQLNSVETGELSWPAAEEKTLVYFFAPWCSMCRISMPGLNLLTDKNLRVVAIAQDWQESAEVEEFTNDVGFDGEVFLGDANTLELFRVQGYPSYYVLDQNGRVIHQDQGVSTPPGLWIRTWL
jgi:thiol-disulfide isomerase/thioredoxin